MTRADKRDLTILAMHEEGIPPSEIAAHINVSARHVANLIWEANRRDN